jgi:hypothetical protein
MSVAANFNEGAFKAGENVQGRFQAGTLIANLTAWIAGIASGMNTPAGAFDPASIAQRTVLNWIPVGNDLLQRIASNQASANEVANYVFKTCRAIQNATAQGRMSNAQAAAMLVVYNAQWA